jgi:AraC-like DNA-binding protein
MKYIRYDTFRVGVRIEDPDDDVPDLVHVGEEWGLKTYFIPPQTHVFWNLYYQVEGTSEWELGGTTYRLSPGGFWASPPNISHGMLQLPPERHHYFYMGFHLRQATERLGIPQSNWPETGVHSPKAQSLFEPFRHLVTEASIIRPLRTLGLRLTLDSLIVEATRLLSEKDERVPGVFHPAVEIVRDILERQPGEGWKISDLANIAGVSPPHLIRLFTKEIGVSPHQYLTRVRIQRAQEALRTSDIAITDLAHDLGFHSSQHFASSFKAAIGITAQQYRKQSRTKDG